MYRYISLHKVFLEQWQILRLSTGVDDKVNIFQLYIKIDYSVVQQEKQKESKKDFISL